MCRRLRQESPSPTQAHDQRGSEAIAGTADDEYSTDAGALQRRTDALSSHASDFHTGTYNVYSFWRRPDGFLWRWMAERLYN